MAKIKRWTLVEIEWVDSCHTSGWTTVEGYDWKDHADSLHNKTTGYVAHRDKETIAVVQSHQDKWTHGHPRTMDAIMMIPLCAVKRMTVLKKS